MNNSISFSTRIYHRIDLRFILAAAVLAAALFFFFGCSPGITQATIVQDRIEKITPDPVTGSVQAEKHDTVVIATKIVQRDTVVDIRYYPGRNIVTYVVKPDTIVRIRRDTVQVFYGFTSSDLDSQWMKGFRLAAILIIGSVVMFLVYLKFVVKK